MKKSSLLAILIAGFALCYQAVSQPGGITGTKFLDQNKNGVRDAEDVGLPGWKIYLSEYGYLMDSVVTDAAGVYQFMNLYPGAYSVKEEHRSPWLQTFPESTWTLNIDTLVRTGIDFGNFLGGSISGMKFSDDNHNGARDPSEPGLPGWKIYLFTAGHTIDSTLTDPQGQYLFSDVPPGTYFVFEEARPGWTMTYPLAYVAITVNGDDHPGFDFGNYGPGAISGMKFADLDSSGSLTPADKGIPRWKIFLFLDGTLVDSTLTDTAGRYSFLNLSPGQYTVVEEQRPKWTQTYPPTGQHHITVSGGSMPDADFGNFRRITRDTVKSLVTDEVIMDRDDRQSTRAFLFSYLAPPPSAKLRTPSDADGALPAGTIVRSWDSSEVIVLTSDKYLVWMDLTGDLKYSHPCQFVLIDKLTGEVDSMATSWWPVIQTPGALGPPVEAYSSWDDRMSSADLFYGTYTPVPSPKPAAVHRQHSPMSVTTASDQLGAVLIGGKGESPSELAVWQNDLDSVSSILTSVAPEAVKPEHVFMKNNATTADLRALFDSVQAHGCDTVFYYFTGHGDSSLGGGTVFNDVSIGRVTVTYATLSAFIFDSLSIERAHLLIDASNSGRAINDFMKTSTPVVNIITSTDAHSAARWTSGNAQSLYTYVWQHIVDSVPLPPSNILNWRTSNSYATARNDTIRYIQHSKDSSNASLAALDPPSIAFPDVAVHDEHTETFVVTNEGWITLAIDSVRSSNPVFSIVGDDAGTLVRNGSKEFSVKFAPAFGGLQQSNIALYHNGEVPTSIVHVAAVGRGTSDSLLYRTLVQDSLTPKAVKKKNVRNKFCATITNASSGTRDGLIVKFSQTTSVTSCDSLPTFAPVDAGKTWTFSGGTIPPGHSVVICGIGSQGRIIRIQSYQWKSGAVADKSLRSTVPPPDTLLLPMPNFGNVRDDIFRFGGFGDTGMVVGIARLDSPKAYGWIRITKGSNAQSFFPQAGRPRPFDTLKWPPFRAFVKQQKNLKASKYTNHLSAETAALKIAIAGSRLQILPIGLGELVYADTNGNPLNGLMLKEIVRRADSALTHWRRFSDTAIYTNLDTTIRHINCAFAGPIDTSSWGIGLSLKGVKTPLDVGFIHSSGAMPEITQPYAVEVLTPEQYGLYQNYPNPFNPATTIRFDLPDQAIVTLKVYNILGQEVAVLFDHEMLDEGTHEAEFIAGTLASGVYFYRISAQSMVDDQAADRTYKSIRKMMILK